MVLRILALLVFANAVSAQVVKQFRVKMLTREKGGALAVLVNSYKAPATAYIVQATYQLKGKQQPTAWGGDSYSYPDGGSEIPAGFEAESNSLPEGAVPLTSGVIAVIYADGFSEGDENVVQMLLSGRRRMLADLNQLLPELEKTTDYGSLLKTVANLRTADMQEAAKLDELITVPGVKHQYFMTAVPAWLARDKTPAAETYRRWRQNIMTSKPAF